MKAFLGTMLLILTVTQAQAGTRKLLDCNMNFGVDQQATVIQVNGTLQLHELTSYGSWKTRELSREEWQSGRIQLREEDGEITVLSLAKDGWRYDSQNVHGYADCE